MSYVMCGIKGFLEVLLITFAASPPLHSHVGVSNTALLYRGAKSTILTVITAHQLPLQKLIESAVEPESTTKLQFQG